MFVAHFYSFLHPKLIEQLYYLLPSDVTELNKYICGHLDRERQLCGRCKNNIAYQFTLMILNCLQCSTSPFNWVKYILAAFLPLTVFFVLVASCRLSTTPPKLFAFVFFIQSIVNVHILLAGLDGYPLPTC